MAAKSTWSWSCRGADLLVHDAQYTAEELETHRGWGHSSFDQAMPVAETAGGETTGHDSPRPGTR